MTGKIFGDIKYLKGVGPKRAEYFKNLGILTVYDLLCHFPRGYIDYTSPVSINEAILNENNIIKARVIKKFPPQRIRKGFTIFKAVLTDDTNDITLIIYNNEFLYNKLKIDEEYILFGKVTGNFIRKEISSPLILSSNEESKIQPIYPLTEGLTQLVLRQSMKNALEIFKTEIIEFLPQSILKENELCSLMYALETIHFPKDSGEVEIAKKRLIFEELLVLQLGMLLLKSHSRALTGTVMTSQNINEYFESLPFELTNAQKNAINDCVLDMQKPTPMNRLIQGDVGSGKTAVAAACCYFAHKNGYQSALMAPTEILASQHFETLKKFLSPLGVRVCLLSGSLTQKQKNETRKAILEGEYSVIVGTHALVQKNTDFKNLGLVITDEQHRFGVEQRTSLANKGENPHSLVMSATPIPRTLAMMIYGNLDISILNELPKGRIPIETYAITGKLRERAYGFIEERLREGRQAYIVCPMIEENDMELRAVSTYKVEIEKTYFKNYKVGLLHGKMPSGQKDEVMESFKNGEIDLLVSTTVVEVGVDVPNASVILIENSDRFGLSQLHQLRGRVGRGKEKSYCILVTDNATDECKKRLRILSSTSDGFKISEEDLKLRGPGDFFGNRQHGLPKLKIANMVENIDVLKSAQEAAQKILENDPKLENMDNRGLRFLIKRLFDSTYQTSN